MFASAAYLEPSFPSTKSDINAPLSTSQTTLSTDGELVFRNDRMGILLSAHPEPTSACHGGGIPVSLQLSFI